VHEKQCDHPQAHYINCYNIPNLIGNSLVEKAEPVQVRFTLMLEGPME